MPQLNKGGKYVFGWSVIGRDGTIRFPPETLAEYGPLDNQNVIIFTGSRSTSGFCVTNKRMLSTSILNHILNDLPKLTEGLPEDLGRLLPYKGRSYAWFPLSRGGTVQLPQHTLEALGLRRGDKLMSIRSSGIAFTMGANGPLVEKGNRYPGLIEVFLPFTYPRQRPREMSSQ